MLLIIEMAVLGVCAGLVLSAGLMVPAFIFHIVDIISLESCIKQVKEKGR